MIGGGRMKFIVNVLDAHNMRGRRKAVVGNVEGHAEEERGRKWTRKV